VTPVLKHATASVFLFHHRAGGWRVGLIRHPRLHRWMLPGGHVEGHENSAEAALREVREETGHTAQLIAPPGREAPGPARPQRAVAMPWWIVEQDVPGERRLPHLHVHVDHLYVAVTADAYSSAPAELPFAWYQAGDLNSLDMFDDSRVGACHLLDHIHDFTASSAARRPGRASEPTLEPST
jgi:8-oxo-dGTP pyrophosphatase MutT (NUDIX family)